MILHIEHYGNEIYIIRLLNWILTMNKIDKRAARSEKTRKRIMTYAGRIFYERGFRKITVEELCVGLAISKRTFYKYFANRDVLVEAVITERFAQFGPLIYENLNSSKPVDDILKTHFDLLLNNLFTHVTTQMLADIQIFYPEMWDRIEAFRAGLIAVITELLQRGQKDGTLNLSIDPVVVGKIIQGVIINLANPQFLLSHGLSVEQLLTNWQNLMLHGVLAPQDRE